MSYERFLIDIKTLNWITGDSLVEYPNTHKKVFSMNLEIQILSTDLKLN